jgi:hypothetical protein
MNKNNEEELKKKINSINLNIVSSYTKSAKNSIKEKIHISCQDCFIYNCISKECLLARIYLLKNSQFFYEQTEKIKRDKISCELYSFLASKAVKIILTKGGNKLSIE